MSGPVKWLTIRSDNNDKFAQPDGLWIGQKGTATNVTAAGPKLKGATNVVIPRIDHRETSYSPAAFEATYRFITGKAPARTEIAAEKSVVLNGKVTGLGVDSADPKPVTSATTCRWRAHSWRCTPPTLPPAPAKATRCCAKRRGLIANGVRWRFRRAHPSSS